MLSKNDPLNALFPLTPALKLSHCIVLAPMTRMRASSLGIPHPFTGTYYASRATSGGLLISEGIVPHPRGRGFPNTPGLYTEEQVEAWKGVTGAVKEKGAVFFAQLWHAGRVAVPSQTGGYPPLSSTSIPLPGNHPNFGQPEDMAMEPYVKSQAMSLFDIQEVIYQFVVAAKNAIRAGFDGIELHAGNGYLFDQFTHSNINDRTDQYGGCLENKLRFLLDTVDAISKEIGSSKVAVRLAPWYRQKGVGDGDDDRVATFTRLAEELEKRGLAFVDLIEPRHDAAGWNPFAKPSEGTHEEFREEEMNLWPFRKALRSTPVIGAGGYDAESARSAVEEGRVDLVAFGRHFTSNPDLVRRVLEGLPLTDYQRSTFYTSQMEGYVDWKTWEEMGSAHKTK